MHDYRKLSAEELRVLERDLKLSLDVRYTSDKWSRLGAVRAALLAKSPHRIKPLVHDDSNYKGKRQWRPVKYHE